VIVIASAAALFSAAITTERLVPSARVKPTCTTPLSGLTATGVRGTAPPQLCAG
jgi:hypothetical protein